MAENGVSSSRGPGASLSAAATAAGSAEARFAPQERRSRWGGCFGGLSCFGSQKGGKRIVPASRTPDGNTSSIRGNGPQSATLPNQTTSLNPSLLAPPSSPASFTNSALQSTAPSPSCFLSVSANSLAGPSSTMFVTGPYAHETQLVSPPGFSTYTTEPSTAPITPPPELAHLTTPSSPDVPFARFLSSSVDLRATYALYPGSPSSSLISPASGTPRTGMTSPFPDSSSAQDSPRSRNGSSRLFGLGSTSKNFFCPATSAQFYLDQAQQSFPSYSHCGGKSDAYSSGGNRHSKPFKQDVEEIEAYRASFGFSADEIITTQSYVEISEPADDSFTMTPFANNKLCMGESPKIELTNGVQKMKTTQSSLLDHNRGLADGLSYARKGCEQTFLKSSERHVGERTQSGQSCSDAEIDYRRARSLRDTHGILAWRKSLP